uniref:ATP synthase subunit a n=1 Tax=Cherax sp. YPL-2015 TaxID=1593270 RepID=A0A0B5A0M5_9EUCA|nr:ATP synthase F0 subunit 6 [Cherax sp. YPL-2015]
MFEPSSSILSLNLNWMSTFLVSWSFMGLFFLLVLLFGLYYEWYKGILHIEFKTILGPSNLGLSFLFVSLFSFILFNNSLGLLPYIFTSSSHLVMTLTLALPLWLSFILFGWVNHTQHMFAHLVPQGTPNVLMPFMVLIETISNIIRPGTLAIRLAANMIAGHLLLTLLGSMGSSLSSKLLIFLILAQILLLMLESAVAIIQSYVFAVLSTLYASEVN